MIISILTLFKEMFVGPFDHSIIKNAIKKNLVKINFINIRDFGIGRHKIVDDKPYGGGKGMIMRVDVLEKAIAQAKKLSSIKQKVILLDPCGKTFNQEKAVELMMSEYEVISDLMHGFDYKSKVRKKAYPSQSLFGLKQAHPCLLFSFLQDLLFLAS